MRTDNEYNAPLDVGPQQDIGPQHEAGQPRDLGPRRDIGPASGEYDQKSGRSPSKRGMSSFKKMFSIAMTLLLTTAAVGSSSDLSLFIFGASGGTIEIETTASETAPATEPTEPAETTLPAETTAAPAETTSAPAETTSEGTTAATAATLNYYSAMEEEASHTQVAFWDETLKCSVVWCAFIEGDIYDYAPIATSYAMKGIDPRLKVVTAADTVVELSGGQEAESYIFFVGVDTESIELDAFASGKLCALFIPQGSAALGESYPDNVTVIEYRASGYTFIYD